MKFQTLISIALVAFASVSAQDSLRISIQAAMLSAPKNGMQVQMAESRVREAEARVDEAKSALLPSINATASDVIRSYNYASMLPPSMLKGMHLTSNLITLWNVQDARLGTHLTLFNYAAWKRFNFAKENTSASQKDAQVASEQSSVIAADAWLCVARAILAVHSRQHQLELAQQSLQITQQQITAGTVTQFDLIRAQGQIATATANLTAAKGNLQTATIGLQRALGLNMNTQITLSDSLQPPVFDDKASVESFVQQALRDRTEISSAQQKLQIAENETKIIAAEDYPTVDLAADYGASAYQFKSNEFTGTVAVQLTWSIYDGGRRSSRKAQQQEHLTQASIQLDDIKKTVEQEVRRYLSQMSTAKELVKTAQERVSLVNQELNLAQQRFSSGMSGLVDVITAQNNLSLAEDANIDALYQFNQARLYFLKATHHLENL